MPLIGYLRTPIIRLFDGKRIVAKFYTCEEFNIYQKEHDTSKYCARYYMILGLSNDDDIKNDSDTLPTVIIYNDDIKE